MNLIFLIFDQRVNYIVLLAKFTWTSLGFIHFACDPMEFILMPLDRKLDILDREFYQLGN